MGTQSSRPSGASDREGRPIVGVDLGRRAIAWSAAVGRLAETADR